jgi:hypothetical protein
MRSRVEDETNRRKKAESERNTLIKSLDDMTLQAKRLENMVRDYEKENIDIYEKLRKTNDDRQLAIKELNDIRVELRKESEYAASYSKVIEDQKLLIGQQSIEINQLKINNKAFDLSNKENVMNMNSAIERVALMSNERHKVTHELDNIIQRRKSVKNLRCSNSFHQLSENKPYETKFKDTKGGINSITNQSC